MNHTTHARHYLDVDQALVGQDLVDLSDPRTLNKLVSSLMYLFHFSAKAELAFILGYPSALNNQQVLCNWITDTLKQAEWIEPAQLLEFLVARLKRELMQWQEVA
jgi:hypothetical protein